MTTPHRQTVFAQAPSTRNRGGNQRQGCGPGDRRGRSVSRATGSVAVCGSTSVPKLWPPGASDASGGWSGPATAPTEATTRRRRPRCLQVCRPLRSARKVPPPLRDSARRAPLDETAAVLGGTAAVLGATLAGGELEPLGHRFTAAGANGTSDDTTPASAWSTSRPSQRAEGGGPDGASGRRDQEFGEFGCLLVRQLPCDRQLLAQVVDVPSEFHGAIVAPLWCHAQGFESLLSRPETGARRRLIRRRRAADSGPSAGRQLVAGMSRLAYARRNRRTTLELHDQGSSRDEELVRCPRSPRSRPRDPPRPPRV